VAERAQAPQQQVVALDRGPDAGQGVQVGHQPAGLDPVAGVAVAEVVGRVSRVTLRPNVAIARRTAPADGAQTRCPRLARVLAMIPGSTTTRSVAVTPRLRWSRPAAR